MLMWSEKLVLISEIPFTNDQQWIERVDAHLQDIMLLMQGDDYRASGELVELKAVSWTLHERYYMDTPEQLKWTFYHTRHRIIKCLLMLIEKQKLAA